MAHAYPPPLTPMADVLAPSYEPGHKPWFKISPDPFVYLKIIKLTRLIGNPKVNFRMRVLGGDRRYIHAYFGTNEFEKFVNNGTIRVGQVLEIRKYGIGFCGVGRRRFMCLLWIYPIPLSPVPVSTPVAHAVDGEVHTVGRLGGPVLITNCLSRPALEINGPVIAIESQSSILGRPAPALSNVNGPAPISPAPEVESGPSYTTNDNPGRPAPAPALDDQQVPIPALKTEANPTTTNWLLTRASPRLTELILKMHPRTMLSALSKMHMRHGNFLAVVLGRRHRPDSNTIPKQDWYLWDQSSGERKTIISVWGELSSEFQPTPGMVVALWNVQINTRYEDNPTSARLSRLSTGGKGHLNAYRDRGPRCMLEPVDVNGYGEIRGAWEARQRARINFVQNGPEDMNLG